MTVTFSRAYPRVAFWYRIIVGPFVQTFTAMFMLSYLALKWSVLGVVALFRWGLPLLVAGVRRIAERQAAKEIS